MATEGMVLVRHTHAHTKQWGAMTLATQLLNAYLDAGWREKAGESESRASVGVRASGADSGPEDRYRNRATDSSLAAESHQLDHFFD